MGYDVVPGSAPPPRRSGRPSSLVANMAIVAAMDGDDVAGREARIFDSASAATARVLSYQLTKGVRATNGRPEGTWAFSHGPIAELPGRFGVWAKYWPPAAQPQPQED